MRLGKFAPAEDQPWNATVEPLGEGLGGGRCFSREPRHMREVTAIRQRCSIMRRWNLGLRKFHLFGHLLKLAAINKEEMNSEEDDRVASSPHDAREMIMSGTMCNGAHMASPGIGRPRRRFKNRSFHSPLFLDHSIFYEFWKKNNGYDVTKPLSVPLIAVSGRPWFGKWQCGKHKRCVEDVRSANESEIGFTGCDTQP